jgi:hypothetical protein
MRVRNAETKDILRYLRWGGVEALSGTVLQPWIKEVVILLSMLAQLTSLIFTVERRGFLNKIVGPRGTGYTHCILLYMSSLHIQRLLLPPPRMSKHAIVPKRPCIIEACI